MNNTFVSTQRVHVSICYFIACG